MTHPQTAPLVRECFDQFYAPSRLRGASPSTLNQFRVSLENFGLFLGKRPRTWDLTDENLIGAAYWMVERGRSPATANKLLANLRAIWEFLARTRRVKKFPTVKKLKEPERIPVAWSRSQMEQLWRALLDQEGEISGVPSSLWWISLHAVFFDTAERKGAVFASDWNDLDLHTGTILFPAQNRKWKTRDKIHFLHPDTVAILRKFPEKCGKVWKWPGEERSIYPAYRRILKAAGLPHDRKHLFQCLRRTTASLFEACGGNATDLLDHGSRAVTKKHYLDPRILKQIGPADLLQRPIELTPEE